jgi:hypothetical protein
MSNAKGTVGFIGLGSMVSGQLPGRVVIRIVTDVGCYV